MGEEGKRGRMEGGQPKWEKRMRERVRVRVKVYFEHATSANTTTKGPNHVSTKIVAAYIVSCICYIGAKYLNFTNRIVLI